MIKKIIELHYSAMMYKQKGVPQDWLGRMAFIFNIHFLLFLSSIIFNTVYYFQLKFGDNKILYYIIAIVLGYFVFSLNNKNMEKFILKFGPDKSYKGTNQNLNLINIFLVIFLSLFSFYLFICSFKIQNYI